MDLKGKKVSVVGLARSGRSTIKLLLDSGAHVFVSDSKEGKELVQDLSNLASESLEFEFGTNSDRIYKGRDLVILSPGVSIYNPIIEEAIKKGVPVIGELEFAWSFAKAPVIAVTGTNGKSTTVTLIDNMLRFCGYKSLLAGNIGVPLARDVAENTDIDWIVAEVSSFQLETISSFCPKIGVVTNITPDHTDRHKTMENYIAAKARLFENHGADEFAILNFDDKACRDIIGKGIASEKIWFSLHSPLPDGWFFQDGYLRRTDYPSGDKCIDTSLLPLSGVHNFQNIMIMLCVADILGIDYRKAQESISSFKPLHHRMEFCGEINGVKFYDDSKGSNPGAVIAGIDSSIKPISLIVGGKDKNMDFSEMCRHIAGNVHSLVVIGETGSRIADMVRSFGFNNITDCKTDFSYAVRTAYEKTPQGGTVLLSPACASFDMFRHAEHRGDEFKRIVAEMEKGCNEKKS